MCGSTPPQCVALEGNSSEQGGAAPHLQKAMTPSQENASARCSIFESLPLDVVRLIIAYIPVRPRVLVLSLVCRKFSLLCRQSITFLECPAEDIPLHVLPGITFMDLRWRGDAVFLTDNRSLYPAQISRLSFLKIANIAFSTHEATQFIVDSLPASLTSLSLLLGDCHRYLPKFTDLKELCVKLSLLTNSPAHLTCLYDISSRITDLHAASLLPAATIFARAMPRLRSLRTPQIRAHELASYLSLLPALESLQLRVTQNECLVALSQHFSHLSLHLELTHFRDKSRADFNVLHTFPRLTTLILGPIEVDFAPLQTLTRLHFNKGIRSFTTPMPRLRWLHLPPVAASDAVAFIDSTLQHCPSLTELSVPFIDHDAPESVLREIMSLVATHSSVETLHLNSRARVGERADFVRKFKWLRVHCVVAGQCFCARCRVNL